MPVKNAPATDSKQQLLLKALGHDPQSLAMMLLGSGLALDEAVLAMQALVDMGRGANARRFVPATVRLMHAGCIQSAA